VGDRRQTIDVRLTIEREIGSKTTLDFDASQQRAMLALNILNGCRIFLLFGVIPVQ